jgi:hypothetical protein
LRGEDAGLAGKALLQELQGRGPTLVHEAVEHMARKHGPDVFPFFPSVLLEEGPKVRVLKPENPEVGLVGQRVFGEADTLEVFRIEPVHSCVRISRVT